MKPKSLTVDDLLVAAEMTEENLDSFERTAPETVKALGGRDGLARRSQMTCVGPLPRLTVAEWCAMSEEYELNREHGSTNRGS